MRSTRPKPSKTLFVAVVSNVLERNGFKFSLSVVRLPVFITTIIQLVVDGRTVRLVLW